MERAAQFEATAVPRAFAPTAITPALAVSNPRLYREVFGFAFASSLGDPTIGYPSWNFGLLSTVAYFGIHVDWTGEFSGGSAWNTWNNPSGPVPGFIQTAHANGTKVVLSIAMFDSTSGTPNMCSALQRSNVTIQRTVAEIQAKGIDGVNVDYESNNTTCTEPGTGIVASSQSLFTSFVRNLRAALPAGSYLSVDTYSGAAGFRNSAGAYLGFFDIGALNNYVDSFFVMAYDMEYSNWNDAPLNCPSFCLSPTAPLTNYLFNDTRASAEYRAVVPASKVIMGVPYYGRKECVAVPDPNQIPPNAMGTSVAADGYLDASTEEGYPGNTSYVRHRETRDALGATRWDTFSSVSAGCNREMYWDDAVAIGNKYNLIINDKLRGPGIFALNYGGGAPELWDLINLKFGQCSQAAVTVDHGSPQIPATSITFTGTALCAGTGTFRFSVQPPGGALAVTQDYSTANTWTWDTTGKPLGTYTIQVEARNQGATASYDTRASMTFRLALCVTPTIGSDLASPRLPGTAVTFTTTVTCQGTPEFRFWVLPPGGSWTVVQDYSTAAPFRWDTSRLAYGDYRISVHARTTGTTVAYESFESMPYSLRSCISTALTTDKASPQPTGTQVALTGAATCDGTAQYRFMIQPPGGSWSLAQDFGASAAYIWHASGAGGIYNLEVDARSSTAPLLSMTAAQITFNLTACSAGTLTANPATPQEPGGTILLTGSAACPGSAQYRFSIRKPGAAFAVVQEYSATSTFSWNTAGLPYGVYQLKVDARNAGATNDTETTGNLAYSLQAAACSTPTVTSSLVQAAGNTAFVNISATTAACPHPVYQFWIQAPGSTTWAIAQAYATNSSYHWTTAGLAAGTYTFSVWVRDASRPGVTSTSLGNLDAFANITWPYAPCSGVTISTTPATSSLAGEMVTVSASASGCSNAQYEFWVLGPGSSTWTIAQPFGAGSTFSWNTAGPLPAGQYRLSVWVRDGSSPGSNVSGLGTYDASAAAVYNLTTAPCTGATLSIAPPTSSSAGTAVTVTAGATGCPKPLFEFWILAPGSTWKIAQAYSSTGTYNWTTTGLQSGLYRVSVWVRDASSSAGYDAFVPGASYTLTPTPCTSVTASTSPPSPQAAGATVTISATASGCPNPRYQFWIQAPGHSWTIVRAYSTGASFTWNTTPPAGTYHYSVWVRDASSTTGYDTYFPGATYTLTTTPCTSVSASAAPAPPQASGTPVTITASASGCSNPRYEFWVQAPGGSWSVVQAYSSNATFNWNTSGLSSGAYRYSVWVRDASSAGSYDAFAPGTAYSLS